MSIFLAQFFQKHDNIYYKDDKELTFRYFTNNEMERGSEYYPFAISTGPICPDVET